MIDKPDTSAEAVERLGKLIRAWDPTEGSYCTQARRTMAALVAERDAAVARSNEDEAAAIAAAQRNLNLICERDAARAELAHLEHRMRNR